MESGRKFHNLKAKYEKEYRPKVVVFDQEETEYNNYVIYRL